MNAETAETPAPCRRCGTVKGMGVECVRCSPVVVRDEDGNTVGQGVMQPDGSIIVTPTLAQFLQDRIDEDETAAADVDSPGVWAVDRTAVAVADTTVTDVALVGSEDPRGQREWVTLAVDGTGSVQTGDAAHIARWHPERVLADCEARRRVVENHAQRYQAAGELHDGQTLRLLALAYADHPDYRQEWQP